ncbi:MAG: Hydroxypyruvate isomerase [Microbacteriaceae bacterium]|nr:Hydroxypyruvate isomerase [Microbacteriaceae bacterium]
MPRPDYALVANVSLLFAELPLLDRFAVAADAGFAAVELWWPFADAVPTRDERDSLLGAIAASGLPLAGLNLFGGDMPAGERGVLSDPDRGDEFAANLAAVIDIAERTGCRVFNALYGQRRAGVTPTEQDDTALVNLAAATEALGALGGTVLVEPLSRGLNGAYPIQSLADAIRVVERVRDRTGSDRIAVLFDTFHLANNGEDLVAAVRAAGPLIGHVQLADTPGRGEPGSGTIDFAAVLDALSDGGYDGAIAAEYVPTTRTVDTLAWVATTPHVRLKSGR